MTRRKRFDRKKKVKLRRMLAERDGLVPPGAFDFTPNPFVRCAECDGLVLFSEITIGHLLPLSDNGSSDPSNLRLECDACNQADNDRRHRIRSILRKPQEAVPLSESRWLLRAETEARALAGRRVYDSVRVLDVRGETVSFTSIKRASHLVESGRLRLIEKDAAGNPRTIQLTELRRIMYPHDSPHENLCLICDARRYLRPVHVWPRWHPLWRGAKKSHRSVPLCMKCALGYERRVEELLRGVDEDLPHPPPQRDLVAGARLVRAALRLLRIGKAVPETILKKAREKAGIDLEECLEGGDSEEARGRLAQLFLDLREQIVLRRGIWTWAIRRQIVERGVDFQEVFWTFVEERRRLYAPYLRTDGAFAARLKDFLSQVRAGREREREAQPAFSRTSPQLLHSPRKGAARSWNVGARRPEDP